MEQWEKKQAQRYAIRNEVVELLKEKTLSYDEALKVLEITRSYLERAALKTMI